MTHQHGRDIDELRRATTTSHGGDVQTGLKPRDGATETSSDH